MPSDPNAAAALTVKLATEEPDGVLPELDAVTKYLAEIGRRGGIKGGKARKEALSAKRRKEIAKKAATARWADKGKRDVRFSDSVKEADSDHGERIH